MSNYLLVGSRDPLESAAGRRVYELAGALADHGDQVTVYLVQNAVLAARSGSSAASDLAALASRARVHVDDFSLRQRAVAPGELVRGLHVSDIDTLVDLVAASDAKPLWL